MKQIVTLLIFLCAFYGLVYGQKSGSSPQKEDFAITSASVEHKPELGLTVWEIQVKGRAGATTPVPKGQLNGAPVLGYVFPTTLSPEDVGFGQTEGILALALTSHPDFDDTPIWDENNDRIFDNDGMVWHPHWVVLRKDDRVPGGLSVRQFEPENEEVQLPPTNPGMPMYMDSPGFPVLTKGNSIRVMIPDYRINHQLDFNFDGVTCYMEVNTEDPSKPMLGVYEIYQVASQDLSLPYSLSR